MSSAINGNAGGASALGVNIQCVPADSANTSGVQFADADASGNFSFTGLTAGTYVLYANTGNVTSGAYLGFVYRKTLSVTVDGVNDVNGVGFFPPVAPNSPNS